MAIVPTSIAAAITSTDATSFNTASIAVPSHYNELFLVAVMSAAAADPNIPTFSQQRGLNFAQSLTSLASGSDFTRITVFYSCIASGGGTGSFTFDFAGQTQTICAWDVITWTGTAATAANNGADALGVKAQTANISNATSISRGLAAFQGVGSATFGAGCHGANENVTAGSGYAKLNDIIATLPTREFFTEWKAAGASPVDASWTTNSHPSIMNAYEIKVAGSVTTDTQFVGLIPI